MAATDGALADGAGGAAGATEGGTAGGAAGWQAKSARGTTSRSTRIVGANVAHPGPPVARCTVERLMRALGLRGAVRGRAFKVTTVPGVPFQLAMPSAATSFVTMSMPTSLHIPKELLTAVDRRARTLEMSRNRFVVRTLEKELAGGPCWSPGFFEQLTALAPDDSRAVDAMPKKIRSTRTRKGAPRL